MEFNTTTMEQVKQEWEFTPLDLFFFTIITIYNTYHFSQCIKFLPKPFDIRSFFQWKIFTNHTSNKFNSRSMYFFKVGRKRGRKTDFVHKLIRDSAIGHYNSDGTNSVHATAQSKNNHLKTLNIWDWKADAWITISFFIQFWKLETHMCLVICFLFLHLFSFILSPPPASLGTVLFSMLFMQVNS